MVPVSTPGPDQAQLNVRISAAIVAELDELCSEYRLTKEGLCQALLAHALGEDQIEVAVQKAKDAADQRMRARRQKRRESSKTLKESTSNVVQLAGTEQDNYLA